MRSYNGPYGHAVREWAGGPQTAQRHVPRATQRPRRLAPRAARAARALTASTRAPTPPPYIVVGYVYLP